MKKPGAYDKKGNLICELTKEDVEKVLSCFSIFEEIGIPTKKQWGITKVVLPYDTTRIGEYLSNFCKKTPSIS